MAGALFPASLHISSRTCVVRDCFRSFSHVSRSQYTAWTSFFSGEEQSGLSIALHGWMPLKSQCSDLHVFIFSCGYVLNVVGSFVSEFPLTLLCWLGSDDVFDRLLSLHFPALLVLEAWGRCLPASLGRGCVWLVCTERCKGQTQRVLKT